MQGAGLWCLPLMVFANAAMAAEKGDWLVRVGQRRLFNAVLRSIDSEMDATLDGSPLGTVRIDPLAIGVGFGWIF